MDLFWRKKMLPSGSTRLMATKNHAIIF